MKNVALAVALLACWPTVAGAQPFEATLPQGSSRLELLPDAPSGREQAWADGLLEGRTARVTRVELPRQQVRGGLDAVLSGRLVDNRVEATGLLASLPGWRALRLRFASAEAAQTWALSEPRTLLEDGAVRIVEVRGAQAVAVDGAALIDVAQAWRAWRAAWEVLPGGGASTFLAVSRGGAVRAVGSGPFADEARRTTRQLRRQHDAILRGGRTWIRWSGRDACWYAAREGSGQQWVAHVRAGGAGAELSLGRRRSGLAVAEVRGVDTIFEAVAGAALPGSPLAAVYGWPTEAIGVVGRLERTFGGEAPGAGDGAEAAATPADALPERPDLAAARGRAQELGARRRAFLTEVGRAEDQPVLTAHDLVLASIEEAVRQRVLGAPGREAPGQPPLEGTDLDYATATLAAIEGLRALPGAQLPRPLVEDLTVAADAIVNAPPGEVGASVRDALGRMQSARAARVAAAGPLGEDLPRVDAGDGQPFGRLDLGDGRMGRLDVGAGALPRADLGDARLPRLEIEIPELGPGADPRGPAEPRLPTGGPGLHLEGPSGTLLSVLASAPHGAEPGVGRVIEAYTRGMDAFERTLPPFLPFAVTLPNPVVIDQGGTRFVLPAGSVFRQRGGEYVIDAPGMLLETPGSAVVIDQATLRFGNGFDQLQLRELTVEEGSTHVLAEAVEATIDRRTETAWISADRAVIDVRPGEPDASAVTLDGVRLYRTPGSLALEAQRFESRSATGGASATDLTLRQDLVGDTSTLTTSMANFDADLDGTLLRADRVEATMVRDGAGNESGRFVLENLDLDDPDGMRLSGADAEIFQDADGMRLVAGAEAASFQLAPDVRLELPAGAEARIDDTAAGLTVDMTAGEALLRTGEQRHRVSDAALHLRRAPDGTTEAFVEVAAADLALEGGRSLSVTRGDAHVLQGSNGDLLIEAAMEGARVDLGEGDHLLLGGGARTRVSQTAEGFGLSGEAGQVDAVLGGRRHALTGVRVDVWEGADGALDVRGSAATALVELEGGRSVSITDGAGRMTQAANGDLLIEAAASGARVDLSDGGFLLLGDGARARVAQTAGGLRLTGEAGEVSARVAGRSHALTGVSLDVWQGADGALDANASAATALVTLGDGRAVRVTDGAARLTQGANGDLLIEAAARGARVDLGDGDRLLLDGGARARITQTAEGLTLAGEAGEVVGVLGGRRHELSGVVLDVRQGADGSLEATGAAATALVTLGDGRAVRVTDGAARLVRGANGDLSIEASAGGAVVDLAGGGFLRLAGGARAAVSQTAEGLRLTGQAGEVTALVGERSHALTGVSLDVLQGADGSLEANAAAATARIALDDERTVSVTEVAARLVRGANGDLLIEAAVEGAVADLGDGGFVRLGEGARARVTQTADGLRLAAEAGEVEALLDGRRHRLTGVGLDVLQGEDGALRANATVAAALLDLGDGQAARVTEGSARFVRDADGDLRIEATAEGALVTLADGNQLRLGRGARARLTQTAEGLELIGELGEVEAIVDGQRLRASGVTLDLRQGADGSLDVFSTVSEGALDLERGSISVIDGRARLIRDAAGNLTVEAAAADAVLSLAGGARLHVAEGAQARMLQTDDGLLLTGAAGRVALLARDQVIEATDATLLLEHRGDGSLRVASAASSARLAMADGRVAAVTGGEARLVLDADGSFRIEAAAQGATVDLGGGDLLTLAGGAGATFAQTEDGLALAGHAGAVALTLDGARYAATGVVLDLQQRDDGGLAVRGEAATASIPLGGERSVSLTRGVVRFSQGADGAVRATALTEAAEVALGDGRLLSLSAGAEVDLEAGPDGSATLTTRLGRAALVLAEDERLDLVGLASTATVGPDGELIEATLTRGAYTRGDLQLDLAGATVLAGREEGRATLEFAAANLGLTAVDESGHLSHLALVDPRLKLRESADGTLLQFSSAGDGHVVVQGHTIAIDGLPDDARWAASARTNADGALEEILLDLPGTVTFEEANGELSLAVTGLEAEVTGGGSRARIGFDQLGAVLEAQGLTATARDGLLTVDDQALALHIGEAHVLERMGDQLGLEGTVTGVDLVLGRGEGGAVNSLDLGITELDFEHRVEGLRVDLRSPDGTPTRIRVRADASGQLLEEASVEIPDGAELHLVREGEFDFTLGDQSLRLRREPTGAYRVRAEGADLAGTYRDVTVTADSELLDVSLDPDQGLVFNDVDATRIKVTLEGREVEVDIEQLDAVMLRMTGYEGATRGAALRLEPTADGSRISLEVRATIDGLPVRLELDDLRELEALATVRENEATVLLHDPSGEGEVTVGVGPLELSGPGVGFRAAYNPFATDLFLSDMGRLLSRDGVPIAPGLTYEPDGVLRAGTSRERAVNVDLALGLPSDRGDGRGRSAVSLAATLEGGGQRDRGRLTLGLSGASSFLLDQTHGDATVFGVPAPNRFHLPTTPFASVGYSRSTSRQRLDLEVGAFANPAAWAPRDLPLDEPIRGGAFAGMRLVRELRSGGHLSLSATVGATLDRDGGWGSPTARLTLGIPLGRTK